MMRQARSRGMTLIEVMISFAILIAGLVSIFAILNAGFRTHNRAIHETEASMVAESVIADLRGDFAHGKVPSHQRGIFHEDPNYPGYRICRSVVPLDMSKKGQDPRFGDREYFIRVEVRWAEQGDDKSISVDTIMYCNLK